MMRPVVGILRGGTSSEYDLSLKTGAAILQALPDDAYDVRDILVDKQGYWYARGRASDPVRALASFDVVLNMIHGGIGEDGTVQRLLDQVGVAYAGSGALPSSMSLNKIRAKEVFRNAGIPQPRGIAMRITRDATTADMARAIFERFSPPYLVKPPSEGASHGIRYAPTIVDLPDAIGDVLDEYGAALIEEYLIGEEAHVGVIEKFRNEDLYVLPPSHVAVETIFLNPSAHHDGTMEHRVPSHFSDAMKRSLADLARSAHRALGLSDFSRADFIVTARGPYLLEVNAIPGLYPGAAFPPMLESVGSTVREFAEHAIALARK